MRAFTVFLIILLSLPVWCQNMTAREIKEPGAPCLLYIDYPSDFLAFNIFIPNLSFPVTGTAHMAEHLLFGSGKTLSAGELDRRLEALGYSADAYTSYDFTCYRTVIRPSDLDSVCSSFAEALAAPMYTEEELALEKGIINDELMGKADDFTKAKNSLLYSLYGDTIFGQPLEGADINAITHDDLQLYHDINYRNENLVFVMAGTPDTKTVTGILARYFPVSGDKPLSAPPALTPAKGIVTARSGKVFGTGCAMAPANLFGESVCCSVLSSLIYLTAKETLPSVRYSHNTGKWTSPFTLLTDSEKGEEVLRQTIADIKAGKYSDRQLQAAKNLQRSDFLTRNQTAKSMTYQLGQVYILNGIKAIGDYPEYISSVSREDIAKAAEKYL